MSLWSRRFAEVALRFAGATVVVGGIGAVVVAGCGRTELLDPFGKPTTQKVCVRQVAAGPPTCALKDDGTVVCWGDNEFGQVGDGTTRDRTSPTAVAGLGGGVAQIAVGGYQTCARRSDGSVWCWGWGIGDRSNPTAVRVDFGGGAAIGIATGSAMTCATLTDGSLWCWGWGGGSVAKPTAPVRADFIEGAIAEVTINGTNACVRKTDGSVSCWTWGRYQILADGSTLLTSPIPEQAGVERAADLVMGCRHRCARAEDGTLWCWGAGKFGEIGDGTFEPRAEAVQVTALGDEVVEVAAGCSHTCAVTRGGRVSCWGANWAGQLGRPGPTSPEPGFVPGLPDDVVELAAGGWYTCARTRSGKLFCWGANAHGELGDGTTADHTEPRAVDVCPP